MKISPLASVFLIVLIDVMGLTIIIPLLPFYAQHYGASPTTIGLLFASYALCQLFAGPVLGLLSDRFGRKPVLLISQIGTFTGFILLAVAHSLPLIFFARMIDGLTAGNLTVAQAYISDITTPENRAKSFALVGIAFGLGFLLGPTIPASLSHYGLQYPIFFAAFLSALSILATFFLLPGGMPAHRVSGEISTSWFPWKTYLQAFKNKELAPLLLQFLSFIFTFALFISGLALFTQQRFTYQGAPFGTKEVGYLFAFVGFFGIIVQGFLIGGMVKRFGESRLVQFGFLSMMLGALLLGFIHSVPFLLIAVLLSFFGSSILRPNLTSLITQKIGRNQQGVVLGLTQSLMSIAQIVAPVIGGLLIEHHHLSLWAWTGVLISSLGFWLCQSTNVVNA